MTSDGHDIGDDIGDDSDDDVFVAAHAKVAFARIEPMTLGASLASISPDVLRGALKPGTRIERHNREWIMGQVREHSGVLIGRIGFQTGGPTELWDEEDQDFHEQFLPAGTTSPFAVDPHTLRVVFQLRPGLIRVKSFTGALQALMNEASPTERWRVYQELESMDFDDWVHQVDRVAQLKVKLRRPNPHYGGRERVKELVEGTNAQMADVVWTADPDDLQGIDVDEPFVREAIEHTKKYGSYKARGERGGVPSEWDSEQEGVSTTVDLDADPETKDVDTDQLRGQLGPPETEADEEPRQP